MPKKRGKKRKKGKKSKKDAKRLLQEQLLQEKEKLEAAQEELVTELSQLMTNYWQEEAQLTELRQKSDQTQKDIEESREFLQRNITQYDQGVQDIGADVKRTAKEIKNLEKYVVMEAARIEEEYEKIKQELLLSKETLASESSYIYIFKIMHRELMQAALRNEESHAEIEEQCSKSVKSYENQGIVQVSQLKEIVDRQLETFLSIASDCFEKMIGRKTQEVIRDNVTLCRQATYEFKNWMKRGKSECLDGTTYKADYNELEGLDKNISKLERILAELLKVRNAERLQPIQLVNIQNCQTPLMPSEESTSQASEEIVSPSAEDLAVDMRVEKMLERYQVLRGILDKLSMYVKNLKDDDFDYDLEQYEEFADNIIKLIKDRNSE